MSKSEAVAIETRAMLSEINTSGYHIFFTSVQEKTFKEKEMNSRPPTLTEEML